MQNLDIISSSSKNNNKNYLFDYYKKINRKLCFLKHESLINEIINKAIFENNPSKIIDLFILAFLSRDCRYGKGEKLSFYRIINILYSKFPQTTTSIIECIPYYGYWKDLFLIIHEIKNNPINDINYLNLENKIYQIYSLQLLEDYTKYKNNLNDISLAAKYAPREGKHFDKKFNSVSRIIKILYPEIVGPHNRGLSIYQIKRNWNKAKRLYSSMITSLSNVLDVTEIKICLNNINKINFENIPSKCLLTNFKNYHYLKNKIKIIQLPHKIINDLIHKKKSVRSKILAFTEWQDIIKNIQKQKNNFLINKIPIFYNPDSMDNLSYEISFSLALLVSNLVKLNSYFNIITLEYNFTFENDIMNFVRNYSNISYEKNILKLIKKSKSKIKKCTFSSTINIFHIYESYINKYMSNFVKTKKLQDIIIFTTDDYNNLLNNNKISYMSVTELSEIQLRFKKYWNYETIPNITFWNISSDIDLFPKETSQKYIFEMSGKSKDFLEKLLDINFDKELDNQNFYDLSLQQFENKIADSRYDYIRAKLVLSNEGILRNFANSNPNDAMLFE